MEARYVGAKVRKGQQALLDDAARKLGVSRSTLVRVALTRLLDTYALGSGHPMVATLAKQVELARVTEEREASKAATERNVRMWEKRRGMSLYDVLTTPIE